MVEVLEEKLLKLITEDRSFRLAIAGAQGLSDVVEEIRASERNGRKRKGDEIVAGAG